MKLQGENLYHLPLSFLTSKFQALISVLLVSLLLINVFGPFSGKPYPVTLYQGKLYIKYEE